MNNIEEIFHFNQQVKEMNKFIINNLILKNRMKLINNI